MDIMKETDQRFINIEKKIGIFVLTAIAGIVLVVIFTGIQKDMFTPKTAIYFIANSGKDINEGQAVKLSGFKIGKVKRLSLDDVAQVKVELSISTKYMKWIKADSKARLTKEGLIGEGIIEITPGSIKASQIAENGMIAFERTKGLIEMADELREEIKPVLVDIKQIIHYINDPHGDIKQTLMNIRKLAEDIPETKQHLDTLLRNTDRNVVSTASKINSLLDSSRNTVTSADEAVKKINRDIPSIMEKVNKSLENIQKTTEEIKNAAEQTAPKIPDIAEKGSDIADSTKDVMDSVKRIWPIRTFIKQPEEKKLNVDSYE